MSKSGPDRPIPFSIAVPTVGKQWSIRIGAIIHLQSPHDEYSGLTMRREIRINGVSSSVEVLHTMENASRRPVRWSIWQVTQVDASKGLEIFRSGERLPSDLR